MIDVSAAIEPWLNRGDAIAVDDHRPAAKDAVAKDDVGAGEDHQLTTNNSRLTT